MTYVYILRDVNIPNDTMSDLSKRPWLSRPTLVVAEAAPVAAGRVNLYGPLSAALVHGVTTALQSAS